MADPRQFMIGDGDDEYIWASEGESDEEEESEEEEEEEPAGFRQSLVGWRVFFFFFVVSAPWHGWRERLTH